MKITTENLVVESETQTDFIEIDFEKEEVRGYAPEEDKIVFKSDFFSEGKIRIEEE